ncbi:hypothetical protein NC99_14840 [Sunxiuqinia dokdonensis]|uniref:Uncharacterized protein n=1 Tax=Sunxiuqinia dokdonensis TaxID=1409788 RepID=A0A0L8VBZ3_9BACT|nr:hypothetical protein NC99_14840 [Sunxiuqinia dokdonensis]
MAICCCRIAQLGAFSIEKKTERFYEFLKVAAKIMQSIASTVVLFG